MTKKTPPNVGVTKLIIMKTTYAKKRRQQAMDQQQFICKVLDWKEQTMAQHIYNCGLAYLQYYIPGDPIGMRYLEGSQIFWNWWKNKWADRDQEFIDCYNLNNKPGRILRRTQVLLYLQLHDPLELSEDIKPHAVVLGNSYARMYQDVIDNEILKDIANDTAK